MKASFRFSPKILARLGEELNQTFDHSVIELVKNAYDADAKSCTIELSRIALPGGSVSVVDDGDGMGVESIVGGWLVLGRSGKTTSSKTGLGRNPAGSKGLGRLAAIRMGSKFRLVSVQKSDKRRKHELLVDWSLFDSADVVEDIQLDIETSKNQTSPFGTRVDLLDLRTSITKDDVRRLARSLLLLADPFGDEAIGFQIKLVAPEFAEVEELLRKKYFGFADYKLVSSVDSSGLASASILDWSGKTLATATHEDIRRLDKSPPYACPAAVFDFWAFNLGTDAQSFTSRQVSSAELRAWLSSFGGVHIYADDIRVTPYGNAGDDWLAMNLSRSRSPDERPSTNNSIGRLHLHSDGTERLTQKTDRSGFIENMAFKELRAFAFDSLEWLARWRLEQAEARRSRAKVEAPKAAAVERTRLEAAIKKAPPTVRRAINDAFSGYEKSRDKEAEILRKEVQLYRTLSTAGISAATFAHESHGNPLKIITINANSLKLAVPKVAKAGDQPKLAKVMTLISEIQKASANLATLGTTTLSLVRSSKRRVGKVMVHDVITELADMLLPFVEGRSSTIETSFGTGSPFLRTSQAALESILVNFVNNSLMAFERGGSKVRRICISTTVTSKEVEIRISDSGPGIIGHRLKDIWLPGVTADPEGTGLGLTIVRDTVRDLGGTVEAIANGSLGGAEFVVKLPIIGS